MNKDKPVILAITAASGIIYGIKIIHFLLENEYKVDLIISQHAYYIAKQEIGLDLSHDSGLIKKNILNFIKISDRDDFLRVFLNDELWAGPASGSYGASGMIVAPSSMATVAAISSGLAENLITRAADVIIKEGKKLVIVPRETPFSSIHLENMLKLSNIGVRIVPPIVGFYANLRTIEDCIDFAVGKILDASDIHNNLYKRWHNEQ